MGGRETPEQQRARKQRRLRRLFGGDWGLKRRAERAREFELLGKPYTPRGTVTDIKKRAAIKQLIFVLRNRVRSLQRQHYNSDEQIEQRRLRNNEACRRKYANDAKYAIYHRVKRNIKKHLRNQTQSRNWSQRLGYTMAELHAHLERLFVDGMTWENMGEWHIDHIRPVASFTFTSVDDAQFRDCYALSNLQPLYALDNMRKNDIYNNVSMRKQARVLLLAGPPPRVRYVGGDGRDYSLDIVSKKRLKG